MDETISQLIEQYQVRKTYKQKTSFIDWLSSQCEQMGYDLKIEEHKKCRNLIVGDVETADVILSAHYDTQPNFIFPIIMFFSNYPAFILSQFIPLIPFVVLFPVFFSLTIYSGKLIYLLLFTLLMILYVIQIVAGFANKHTVNDNTSGVATLLTTMRTLNPEDRQKVCFVFFDLEEVGLVGSGLFKNQHKEAMKQKPLINFDCVANGNELLFVSKKSFINSQNYSDFVASANVMLKPAKFKRALTHIYTSDQIIFKNSVGVVAAKRIPILGYYLDRIHTRRDTIFQYENIIDLSNMMREFVTKI